MQLNYLSNSNMNSKIYFGRVRHRRFTPREHEFSYRMFMMYVDLDELDHLFDSHWLWSSRNFNIAWFRRSDHLGSADGPLVDAVLDVVEDRTGRRPSGRIMLLTHLRYFGYLMNPVCFYFCYGEDEQSLEAIVAEVNNTPWGEQHLYVLDVKAEPQTSRNLRFSSRKQFHVSPFMPMDIEYDWLFTPPSKRLNVHMENRRDGEKLFDATLTLSRQPITSASLARILFLYPAITLKVVLAIYFEAIRLWLKKTPFYSHTASQEASEEAKGL